MSNAGAGGRIDVSQHAGCCVRGIYFCGLFCALLDQRFFEIPQ
ncbi:hypothetical protein [Paenibacillus tengchongensis]|nr:hypothetical protein [Paenibacillus tengchongensis]